MYASENPLDLEELRERLRLGREKASRAHQRGTPGIQVCVSLTDLMDGVIFDLFQAAFAASGEQANASATLVAHGGYGRRDIAPFSDVDMMLLHAPGTEHVVAPLARRFTHGIYDLRLELGFSLRTIRQACQMSLQDPTIFTSLAESRYLAGSKPLFDKYMTLFRRTANRGIRRLIPSIVRARRKERKQFGETVYLLEPNVKRSRGALREIQFMRWIGFARYGHPELHTLRDMGLLLPQERRRLREAREYLLQLRNELHFHAGRAQDVLDKSEQLRISELRNFPGEEGVLPVEQFMQEYFEHTSYVRYTVAHFGKIARPPTLGAVALNLIATRHIGPNFKVGPKHIRATRAGLVELKGNLTEVLRLLELANLTQMRIHHETWQAIREDMMDSGEVEVNEESIQQFLSLMSQPGRLGEQLRRLHELRVLEKIIPPIKHARALLQFNEYHKYTVDEHSFRAVEAAAAMVDDPGPMGDAYRSLKQKLILHLSLLLHDLGKGFPRDHSELGAEMAAEVAERLKIPTADREMIQLLVLKHLQLAHVAFRQNLEDESVIVGFAVEIGSTDALNMLYLLTCADIEAVGLGVLNDWKIELLTDLYNRTRRQLAGGEFNVDSQSEEKRRDVLKRVSDSEDKPAWERLVASLPAGYLAVRDASVVSKELHSLRDLPPDQVAAWGRYIEERQAVEYTFAAYEQKTEGIFHRLTGALSSHRSRILSAEIHTLADGLVLDRFYVADLDFSGEPPKQRLQEISDALVKAVEDESGKPPIFHAVWSTDNRDALSDHQMPTRVRFDNSTSDTHTIVNVFAYDRLGLLYGISRTLFELGLSVYFAKIGTHLDQVADVFYVDDSQGNKIVDPNRLREIRQAILEGIDGLENS